MNYRGGNMEILAGIVASILTIAVIVMVSSSIKNTIELKRIIDYKKKNNSITNIENTISPINKNECNPTMGDNINVAKKNGFKPTKG